MKIIDNFFSEKEADNIEFTLHGEEFPWFYGPGVVSKDDLETSHDEKYNYQFYNEIYNKDFPKSPFATKFTGFLDKLQCRSLIRIKANLLPSTVKIIRHGFHVDVSYLDSKTAIYYVNSNNGYTEFEDGTKIESIKNRIVIFPANLKHTGTTCTDQKIRTIVNFNYF